jgi:hypothetical protein
MTTPPVCPGFDLEHHHAVGPTSDGRLAGVPLSGRGIGHFVEQRYGVVPRDLCKRPSHKGISTLSKTLFSSGTLRGRSELL